MSALGAKRSKRGTYDKEYVFDSLGVHVGIKYKNSDDPSRGGTAHLEIQDLSKLIPATDIGLVKLEVKKDKSANNHENYQFRIEYELKSNHKPWSGEIDLNIWKRKTVQDYDLSFKSQDESPIHPFEIQINSTGKDQLEGRFKYHNSDSEEYPIQIKNDENEINLSIKTPKRTTLLDIEINRKHFGLQIRIDFSKIGYMFAANLNIESTQEEVKSYGFFQGNRNQVNFKIEVNKALQSIYLKIVEGKQPRRKVNIYKFKFRETPLLILKKHETHGYDLLLDFGKDLPIAPTVRLAFSRQNFTPSRVKNQIELSVSFTEFPDSNSSSSNRFTATLQSHEIEQFRLSGSHDLFAEWDGSRIFEFHSHVMVSDNEFCRNDHFGLCEIECNLSASIQSIVWEVIQSLVGKFASIDHLSFNNKLQFLNGKIIYGISDLRTSLAKYENRLIQIECENMLDMVRVKTSSIWGRKQSLSFDVCVPKSLNKLDKFELAYDDENMVISIDGKTKPILSNELARYEFRFLYNDYLMTSGELTINKDTLELLFKEEHDKSHHDYNILISSNRMSDDSVNIEIKGKTKPSLKGESACPFLSWNTTYVFNQNAKDTVFNLVSKQLMDIRVLEEKCYETPIFKKSSFMFSLASRKIQPYQIYLDSELTSKLIPSVELNLNTLSYPWYFKLNHLYLQSPDQNYIKLITDLVSIIPQCQQPLCQLDEKLHHILKSDQFNKCLIILGFPPFYMRIYQELF